MSLPVRKRLRLKDYDYSRDGYYFVTICSKNKEKIFGTIPNRENNKVEYSFYGEVIEKHIFQIKNHYSNVSIDKYVIMPNHIHLIVVVGCGGCLSSKNPNLSTVIGLFKSGVSRELKTQVWQNKFHDHIIRTQNAYEKIWNYIDTNPLAWEKDCFYF